MNGLRVRDITVRFGTVTALDNVSLMIPSGKTVGLVGESGSGKSTLGRVLLHLLPFDAGTIELDGRDMTYPRRGAMRDYRRQVQIVFQDPTTSLDPRMTVAQAVGQGMRLSGTREPGALDRLLDTVGLARASGTRLPHELSGGQRQRVAIARALAVNPKVIVLDEVTSALDVSVQALILNLLQDLQKEFSLSYLFISHNMAAVRAVSDVVAVMHHGKLLEEAPAESFFANPVHPYSRGLLEAVPRLRGAPSADRSLENNL